MFMMNDKDAVFHRCKGIIRPYRSALCSHCRTMSGNFNAYDEILKLEKKVKRLQAHNRRLQKSISLQ